MQKVAGREVRETPHDPVMSAVPPNTTDLVSAPWAHYTRLRDIFQVGFCVLRSDFFQAVLRSKKRSTPLFAFPATPPGGIFSLPARRDLPENDYLV